MFGGATLLALALGYRKRPYLAFVVPAVTLYAMFVMFPAVEAFRFSLYNWSGLVSRPIGWGSRITGRSSRITNSATRSGITFKLFLAIFAIQNVVGLPLAMALDTKMRGPVYRAALFMPVIVSLVATWYIWQIILGPNIGMLNPMLEKLGQPDWQRDWLADNFLTFKLIWIVQAWQHLGYPIVIFLAGLQAIPQELKEQRGSTERTGGRCSARSPFRCWRRPSRSSRRLLSSVCSAFLTFRSFWADRAGRRTVPPTC